MTHKAEIETHLEVVDKPIIELLGSNSLDEFDILLVNIPNLSPQSYNKPINEKSFRQSEFYDICNAIVDLSSKIKDQSKLLILGEVEILPYVKECLEKNYRFHHWFVVRRDEKSIPGDMLKNEHVGLLLFTKGNSTLNHAVMRVAYEYCRYCNKTTKDYGGKKHLYHSFGTAISDVWKDIAVTHGDTLPPEIINRVKDLFSILPNKKMLTTSLNFKIPMKKASQFIIPHFLDGNNNLNDPKILCHTPTNRIINGDAIKELQKFCSNSVDMIFVDPPYNLSKNYEGYEDNLSKDKYFEWCNEWLLELIRVLKPGGSLFILNVPAAATKHYIFLRKHLYFQNWIAWDALSNPVRRIMPAHYPILYFTKGPKPKVFNNPKILFKNNKEKYYDILPTNYGFCTRNSCLSKRKKENVNEKKELTDLWTDIHRIKHNSLREDHPTLLPPKLLKRLVLLSSNESDLILDCFNGVGTTTLVSKILNRSYCGIEKNNTYFRISLKRHELINEGKDVFSKNGDIPKSKNSNLKRVNVTHYKIPKKTLQLEIKELSIKLNKIPTREEVQANSKYPIEYFDDYFRNWSEAVAAARTTGMSEIKGLKNS